MFIILNVTIVVGGWFSNLKAERTCNNEQASASSIISIYDHNLCCNSSVERWVWYFLWWSISHSSYGSAQLGFSHCVISELFYLKNWTKLKVSHVNLYVWYVTLMKQSITYFSTCQLPELVVKGFFWSISGLRDNFFIFFLNFFRKTLTRMTGYINISWSCKEFQYFRAFPIPDVSQSWK